MKLLLIISIVATLTPFCLHSSEAQHRKSIHHAAINPQRASPLFRLPSDILAPIYSFVVGHTLDEEAVVNWQKLRLICKLADRIGKDWMRKQLKKTEDIDSCNTVYRISAIVTDAARKVMHVSEGRVSITEPSSLGFDEDDDFLQTKQGILLRVCPVDTPQYDCITPWGVFKTIGDFKYTPLNPTEEQDQKQRRESYIRLLHKTVLKNLNLSFAYIRPGQDPYYRVSLDTWSSMQFTPYEQSSRITLPAHLCADDFYEPLHGPNPYMIYSKGAYPMFTVEIAGRTSRTPLHPSWRRYYYYTTPERDYILSQGGQIPRNELRDPEPIKYLLRLLYKPIIPRRRGVLPPEPTPEGDLDVVERGILPPEPGE